ncbi:hypothetical protein LCGC14_2168060, partial [marine sediment metagenome]
MSENQLSLSYLKKLKSPSDRSELKPEALAKFMREFNLETKELLYILSRIERNYKNSGYLVSKLQTKDPRIDLGAISRSVTNKHSKIELYTDLKSREEYDAKLYKEYKLHKSVSESLVTDSEVKRRGYRKVEVSHIKSIQEKNAEPYEKYKLSKSISEYLVTDAENERRAFHKFEAAQRELLRDFFKPYGDDFKNSAVKLIKKITGYQKPLDLVTFIVDRKVFRKEFRKHQKKLKKEFQRLRKSQAKSKVKRILWRPYKNPKALLYPLLKILPIFVFIFSLLYTSFLPEALFFPNEVTSQFLLIPLVFYFSYLVIITKNRIRSRVSDLFYLPTSLGLPVVLGVSVLLGWLDFARLVIPISTILFCFIAF